MAKTIIEIIKESSFKVMEGKYAYVQGSTPPARVQDHFMISTDDEEITVVTKEENLKDLSSIEKNKDSYRLFALDVSVPFYSVGFLAAISEAIAKENINVLIVSTYSKDYFLIKDNCSDKVEEILVSLGMKQENL